MINSAASRLKDLSSEVVYHTSVLCSWARFSTMVTFMWVPKDTFQLVLREVDNEVHVFHEDRMKRRQGNLVWRVEEPLNFKMLL